MVESALMIGDVGDTKVQLWTRKKKSLNVAVSVVLLLAVLCCCCCVVVVVVIRMKTIITSEAPTRLLVSCGVSAVLCGGTCMVAVLLLVEELAAIIILY